MSREWNGHREWQEHTQKCKISQAEKLPNNLYARRRAHIVRLVRNDADHEDFLQNNRQIQPNVLVKRKMLEYLEVQ